MEEENNRYEAPIQRPQRVLAHTIRQVPKEENNREPEVAERDYRYTPRLDASDLIDHSRGRLVRRAGGRKIEGRLAMRETERPRNEKGGQR